MTDQKINRGGRPPSTDPRKAWIMLRANSSEREAIKARFDASPCNTLTEYVRTMAMEGAVIVKEPFADKQLVLQLSAIGNNYNQSAKALNELALAADAVDDPKIAAQIRETLADVEHAMGLLQPILLGLIE